MNIENRLGENSRICKYNLRSKCRRLAAENNRGPSERNACSCSLEECSKNSIGLNDKKVKSNKGNVGPSTSSASLGESASNDQMCSICFEIVLEKTDKRERIFGILPNCNHCFCYGCITAWRQRQPFHRDIARACPICRVPSDAVYSSKCWLDNKLKKEEFIKVNNSYADHQVDTYSRSSVTSASSWSSSRHTPSSSPLSVSTDQEYLHDEFHYPDERTFRMYEGTFVDSSEDSYSLEDTLEDMDDIGLTQSGAETDCDVSFSN